MSTSNAKKRVVLSVLNDLYTDPRVDKMCNSLLGMGFDVLLVGCRPVRSPELQPRGYPTRRLRMLARKGMLFFAGFNIKLFFYLLFQRCDILVANDLDTLLPNFLVSRLRGKEIVYDSHEYYCQMAHLIHRPKVRKVWHALEKFCFPKLKNVITVSASIAEAYRKEYGVEVKVVRNIPVKSTPAATETRASLHLPEEQKIILMQGNHIGPDRGAEELLEALPGVEGAVLLFVGGGPVFDKLKARAQELGLGERVLFRGRVAPEQLFNYTRLADIGVSLDKNASPDHYYSLPNKIFEYIQAGIPVLISDLPERRTIVEQYQVGEVAPSLAPADLAPALNRMIQNEEIHLRYRENCRLAAQTLHWENEEKILREIYGKFAVSLPS